MTQPISLTEHIDKIVFMRNANFQDSLYCGHCAKTFYSVPVSNSLGLMEANNASVTHASGGVQIYADDSSND